MMGNNKQFRPRISQAEARLILTCLKSNLYHYRNTPDEVSLNNIIETIEKFLEGKENKCQK